DAWPGELALAITVASWAGLVATWSTGRSARAIVADALTQGLGEGYGDDILPELSARMAAQIAWQRLIVPLPLRPRDVERSRDLVRELARCRALRRGPMAEYGGAPAFVVATGGSAGGHLASLVALTANDPEYQPGFETVDTSVRGCVPFYGVYDFTNRHNFQR